MSAQGPGSVARLDLPAKADKEIDKLPRTVQGAVMQFMRKFRANPEQPGLRLKQLDKGGTGGRRLFSARVTDDYRAILAPMGGNSYLLLAVRPRGSVYEHLDRLTYEINRVTGGIEYINLQAAEDSLDDHKGATPQPAAPVEQAPLFAAFTGEQLVELGVAAPLLPVIAKLTSEDELLGLAEYVPQVTREVLFALHEGMSYGQVMEVVTRPVAAEEPVDPEDYQAALARPATQVTTEDEDLKRILEDDFTRWQVFLHPLQRKLVERAYSGPARVSGGPGTGKTIVALHRVNQLVGRLEQGSDRPVLLTTFNRSLAADLRARLLELGGPELLARVDVSPVDKLARRVTSEAEPASGKKVISDTQARTEWKTFLQEAGVTRWTPEFLADEWSQVILGQAVNSRSAYFRVRRAGRGGSVSRADRDEIWQLVERFNKRLDERNQETYQQVAERAARLEMERDAQLRQAGTSGHRYRHVVVDEAQDLHPAHWKMLRAMVAPGHDDLFLVGDTHQRIYENRVSLGSLGINIRGRSSRLTLTYRTTGEILTTAYQLLSGEHYDDLDEGTDDLTGYRSVLRGAHPRLQGFATPREELDAIVEQVRAWDDVPRSAIAVCLPRRQELTEATQYLERAGIRTVELGGDGPGGGDGVHASTMHGFKGLEYQRMIIAGVRDGVVPRRGIQQLEVSDPVRYRRERQLARSLLFVAATRARDELAVFWHGAPSPFLPVLSSSSGS